MTVYKIINWKIIKNRNLSKIVNMGCYETWGQKQAGRLGNYLNKDLWLKISEDDYQEIKKLEKDDQLLFENGEGIYQTVIGKLNPSIEGIKFDFTQYKGKEIIFWADLTKGRRVENSIEVIGHTLRQDKADRQVLSAKQTKQEVELQKMIEQIQQEWEQEGKREMKSLEISDLVEQKKRIDEQKNKKEKELVALSSKNEEQRGQISIPPKKY